MRLAQYSLLHHSISRRRVSLPIVPPSASFSLLLELTEGEGEATRLGIGDGPRDAVPFIKSAKEGFS